MIFATSRRKPLLLVLMLLSALTAVANSQHQRLLDSTTDVILQQRIQAMEEYLEDPIQHLQQLDILGLHDDDDDDSSSSNEELDIIQVLDDLEDMFSDDYEEGELARQFYDLGGWQVLASFVSSATHFPINNNKDNVDFSSLEDKILYVRSIAAAALKSALRSNPEFLGPLVLEEAEPVVDSLVSIMSTTAGVPITPLSRVVVTLLSVSHAVSKPGSTCTKRTLEYQEMLAQRAALALEAMLHDNRPAQAAFANMAHAPAKILGRQASVWAQDAATVAKEVSEKARMSRHAIRMTSTLLSLAEHVVHEVPLDQNKELTSVFSTNDWCQAALQAATLSPPSSSKILVFSSLQRTALQTVTTLAPHCSKYYQAQESGVAELMHLLEQLQVKVQKQKDYQATHDPHHFNRQSDINVKAAEERVQQVEAALAAITMPTTTSQ